jgi:hypothetical protein
MDDFHTLFLIAAEEERICCRAFHGFFKVIGQKSKRQAPNHILLPEESPVDLGRDLSIFQGTG